MSNQCCPSSRPSMQNGQTRPLEKKRSFCASLHAEAPPILLVDEPLFCLCHRQKGTPLGSHHSNLFGRGDSQGKPVLVVFQPGSQIQIVAIHRIGDDPGHGDLCLMHTFHHRSGQFTLRLETDGFRDAGFFATSAIFQKVDAEDKVRGRAEYGQGC